MSRLCSDHSRSYPGRSAPCPGKWRATEIDCGEEEFSLSPEQKSAEVILAQHPSGCRVKDRTGRTRRRDDHLDRARPAPGNGSAAEGHRPSLERDCSRFTSCLNRLVRTRMLGGVGRAVSDDRPYPIGPYFMLPTLASDADLHGRQASATCQD